ncbi:MAG TPA: F0F1 ATP synthase subunit gamma [Actinomycetaceae bacterium]|nr:F0F1 ATP synthase subunit gamma [Actinomycetaceae bacterium]
MAAGDQRVFKQKIRSTQTLKKVFRAMEMIAASRIGKAREKALEGTPFTQAVSRAVAAVASHAELDHPLLQERDDTKRVAVFVLTSDRGMAGAFAASVLREAERTLSDLEEAGKEPILYVLGRRGISYFRYRGRQMVRTWEGHSDAPRSVTGGELANEIIQRYLAAPEEGGISEVFTISTRFISMVKQIVEVRRLLPIEVVEEEHPIGMDVVTDDGVAPGAFPLYEFEPDADTVLNGLMPLYMRARMQSILLHSAASELASRQQAMHSAVDNAEELITDYTRLANAARQTEITQEITEIVSGSDALAAS